MVQNDKKKCNEIIKLYCFKYLVYALYNFIVELNEKKWYNSISGLILGIQLFYGFFKDDTTNKIH